MAYRQAFKKSAFYQTLKNTRDQAGIAFMLVIGAIE